jgi:hypothetical protein
MFLEPLEGLTLLLGVAIVWLAIATSRMASATQQAVLLEGEPHLALETVSWGASPDPAPPAHPQRWHFSVDLQLRNPGKVLVNYRVDSLNLFINGNLYRSHRPILNWGGVIHPGTGSTFFYPYVVVPMPVNNPTDAQVSYKITYWAVDSEKRTLTARIQSDLPLTGGPIRFIYTEGPTYGKVT